MNRNHTLSLAVALAVTTTAAAATAGEPTVPTMAPTRAAADHDDPMIDLDEERPDDLDEEEAEGPFAEFRVDLGPSLGTSTWRGDAVASTNLRIGLRFIDLIAPYVGLGVGYGTVDERMITTVAVGAQLWAPRDWTVRPYLRAGALHQHEESVSVIAGDFGNALFGVGEGIRHRPGVEGGAGVDLTFWEEDDVAIYGLLDGSLRAFPDSLGPKVYGSGGFNVGLNYEI